MSGSRPHRLVIWPRRTVKPLHSAAQAAVAAGRGGQLCGRSGGARLGGRRLAQRCCRCGWLRQCGRCCSMRCRKRRLVAVHILQVGRQQHAALTVSQRRRRGSRPNGSRHMLTEAVKTPSLHAGRKRALLVGDVLFAAGAALMGLAASVVQLIAGEFWQHRDSTWMVSLCWRASAGEPWVSVVAGCSTCHKARPCRLHRGVCL